MLSIIKSLLGFGDTIEKVSEHIARARIEASRAATDEKKIAAEERAKALEARRDVLIADAKTSGVNTWVRAALAAPVAILLWKIFVFDKALGQWTGGRTDQLSDELWQVVAIVIGFYFVYEAARLFRK